MDDRHDSGETAAAPGGGLRGLVVETGRGAGACQPLRAPVALVGRAAACDVRVDAQAVRPLHCLLAPCSDGVALRTLHADGTRVNGRPATAALLRDGDLLEVGPVRFRLRWPAADALAGPPHVEALRVQAAAVAAQQAALVEHELKLADREAALARQEEQVAGHLESKRRQLLELQDQITDARTALREKRAAHAALAEQQQRELAAAREEAADLKREAQAERQRLRSLRQRMIQRWRRHWGQQRRAAEAAATEVSRARDRLDAAKRQLADEAARVHTHAELEKRRLHEVARDLAADAKEWQARHAEESRVLAEQTRTLARRAKAVAAEERRIAAEKQRTERELQDRRREFEHLETRIGNARWRLLEHQQVLLTVDAKLAPRTDPTELPAPAAWPVSGDAPAEAVADLPQREAALEQRGQALARVAAELADQRLLLAEQAQRLVRAQEQWFTERAEAMRELAELGTLFQEQERELTLRADEVETAEGRVRDERADLAHARLRLEAERARGAAHSADRRAELDHRAADLDVRERTLARLRQSLIDLYRRWGHRRRLEVEALRAARAACLQERFEWATARALWLRAGARAQEDRQAVAAKALALEEMRKQFVATVDRPAAAKRLERLQRRWVAYCDEVGRDLARLRATLAAEAVRLDEHARRADDEAGALEARAADVEQLRADLERQRAELAAAQLQWEQQLAQAQVRCERADRRAAEQRDEVEQLASLMIDSGPAQVTDRAA